MGSPTQIRFTRPKRVPRGCSRVAALPGSTGAALTRDVPVCSDFAALVPALERQAIQLVPLQRIRRLGLLTYCRKVKLV